MKAGLNLFYPSRFKPGLNRSLIRNRILLPTLKDTGEAQPHQMPERPKRSMSKSAMKDYALSKIFFRLLDSLEEQERTETHPLVNYFYMINKSLISEVCRRGLYIVVQCSSRDDVYELNRLAHVNELSDVLTRYLVTGEVLHEISALNVRLNVDILESELLTIRSDSEGKLSYTFTNVKCEQFNFQRL